MKRNHLFGAIVGLVVAPLCLGITLISTKAVTGLNLKASPSYSKVTLNSTVFGMSQLTTSYQQSVTQNNLGKDMPVINYFLAKKDGSGNLVLAPSGKLFNYSSTATYGGRITTIHSVKAYYSGGALYLQEGLGGSGETYGEKALLSNEGTYYCTSSPNYIMFANSQEETTITKIEIEYTCSEVGYDVNKLGEKYTGKGEDNNLYTLTRNGTTVDFSGFVGVISVENTGRFTMDFDGLATIEGTVSENHNVLTVESVTGPMAAMVPPVEHLYRSYVVDNFDGYSSRGSGIKDQASFFTASELRGAYYVDVTNGTTQYVEPDITTLVSGSSFKVPQMSANYLNLNSTMKHGDTGNAMLLQGRKAGWVRLWTSNVFNTTRHDNFGQGTNLSFWAHGARSNNDGSGNNSSSVSLRVQVYYENFTLTDSSRTTYADDRGSGTTDITIPANSDWTQYTININPHKPVKALNIMVNNSGLSTDYVFIPIDDIEIYSTKIIDTVDKYAESATAITKTYNSSITTELGSFAVKVDIGANGYAVGWAGANMDITGYAVNGDQITFTTNGYFPKFEPYTTKDYYYGTWVGTLSENNTKITVQKDDITGDITELIQNTEIVFVQNTVLPENVSTLSTMLQRQYKDGSNWVNDGELRMSVTTDYYVEGGSSLVIAPNSNRYDVRYIVKPSVIEAQSLEFDTLSFWYFAPAYKKMTIQVFTYKTTNATGEFATKFDKDIDGTNADEIGWHCVDVGLDKSKGFGKSFAIYFSCKANNAYLDYVTYF